MAVMTELETNPKQTPFFFLTDHNHVVRIPIRLLSKVKSSRETETLRARLPAQLAQFASNISIIEPIQTIRISHTDEVYCCSLGLRNGERACQLQWFHLRIHSRKTQSSHVLSLSNSFGKTGRQVRVIS
jgi:hypothetical protein